MKNILVLFCLGVLFTSLATGQMVEKQGVGQMTYDCMKNLIIYQEHPTYLLHNQIQIKDNRHKTMVKSALKSIAKFFDNAKKKKH